MTTEELIELQEEIEQRKTQKAQLEGERNAIMKQLKEEFGCVSIKQVEAVIAKKEKEVEALEEEIESGLAELETTLKQIG
jgi:seryl-tRNA synthetase